MDQNDILNPKSGAAFGIIIAEAAVAAIILLSVLTVKYFFKGTYSEIKKWYNTNICAETEISEVIDTSGGGVDEV